VELPLELAERNLALRGELSLVIGRQPGALGPNETGGRVVAGDSPRPVSRVIALGGSEHFATMGEYFAAVKIEFESSAKIRGLD
jgi:hypothetical protein